MEYPTTSGVTEGFGLMFYNARWYDPYLNHFVQADTIIPNGIQGYDRYAYVQNSPLKYTDPTGHVNQNQCNYQKNSNCDIYQPKFTGKNWTDEEKVAIIVAYNLAIRAFGGLDNFESAMGGSLTFKHVNDLGKVGTQNKVAEGGYRTIGIDAVDFPAMHEKMTWYALHEMGHTFDWAGSKGDPEKYKSQLFVATFSPGCPVVAGVGCSGTNWKPSDTDTTRGGLVNSVEDFADSFASTILLNAGMGGQNPMTYRDVGIHRQILINVWILAYNQ
jgi:RHS repeat-associated protein